jgi:hypothetical protein
MPDKRTTDLAMRAAITAAADPQASLLSCGKATYLRLTPDEQRQLNRSIRAITKRLPLAGTVTGLEILTAIGVKIAQIEDMDNAND